MALHRKRKENLSTNEEVNSLVRRAAERSQLAKEARRVGTTTILQERFSINICNGWILFSVYVYHVFIVHK